jgi:Na+-translocating ferredoxin:NAD+ oxidoreductase RnfC subunit
LPRVREGDAVQLGQLLAAIPEGKLGANVHASIAGRVTKIDEDSIWLSR